MPSNSLQTAFASTVSVTRPNDTSAYSAGDVIGSATGSTAALQFAKVGPGIGGDVIITTVRFEWDASSIPSGATTFTLYLYGATPPSALGDNAAWDLPSGDRAAFKGSINVPAPVDLGSTLYVETSGVNKQINVPYGGSLYAYLVTAAGFTPTASAVMKITIHTISL